MGGRCEHCCGVIQRVHMLRGQKRGRALACRAQLSAADSSPQHSNVRRSVARRSAVQRSAAQLMPHVAFRLDDRLRIGSQPLAPARHLFDVGDSLACRDDRQGRQAGQAGGRRGELGWICVSNSAGAVAGARVWRRAGGRAAGGASQPGHRAHPSGASASPSPSAAGHRSANQGGGWRGEAVQGCTPGPNPHLGIVVTHVAPEAVAAGLAGQSWQDEALPAACRGSHRSRQGSQLLQHC